MLAFKKFKNIIEIQISDFPWKIRGVQTKLARNSLESVGHSKVANISFRWFSCKHAPQAHTQTCQLQPHSILLAPMTPVCDPYPPVIPKGFKYVLCARVTSRPSLPERRSFILKLGESQVTCNKLVMPSVQMAPDPQSRSASWLSGLCLQIP